MKIKKTKKRVYREYDELLFEYLKDPREAVAYLQAALEDEDETIFLDALRDVLQARRESIASLAEETDLNKQNLYRMLSPKGNPRLNSLRNVLDVMGFQMSINLKK